MTYRHGHLNLVTILHEEHLLRKLDGEAHALTVWPNCISCHDLSEDESGVAFNGDRPSAHMLIPVMKTIGVLNRITASLDILKLDGSGEVMLSC